jgi:subtilisin family serine protease
MKAIIVSIMYFITFFPIIVYGEGEYSNIIWVEPVKASAYPENANESPLGLLLTKHLGQPYQKALPFAKHPRLQNIYQMVCKSPKEAFILTDALQTQFKEEFSTIRHLPAPISTYDPSDPMWQLTMQDTTEWLWHLAKIKGRQAWDISKGSPNVKIAIIDTWFDINHPDLQSKLTTNTDPMDGTAFNSTCFQDNHGTSVASFAAAHTDGGGQLASIGFNTMIIPYRYNNGLAKALHASNVMNADIISISWFWSSRCNLPDDTGQEQLIIEEILNNGTIIVASAGNGYMSSARCPQGDNVPPFTSLYPFSPTYDSRIICVTSTDKFDNHTYYENGNNLTHSHYPEVDICAPGYCVMGATGTKSLVNGNCVDKEWPYYGCGTGTSFATPIVAGVCGLMKAVNPCINPAEAQEIIKSTADPVNDAHLYPGKVGAGRINAYKAVKKAATRYVQNITYSGTQSITAHIIEVGSNVTSELPAGNVIVPSGSNVTFTGRHTIVLDPGFEVSSNGYFEVIVDANAVITCN